MFCVHETLRTLDGIYLIPVSNHNITPHALSVRLLMSKTFPVTSVQSDSVLFVLCLPGPRYFVRTFNIPVTLAQACIEYNAPSIWARPLSHGVPIARCLQARACGARRPTPRASPATAGALKG